METEAAPSCSRSVGPGGAVTLLCLGNDESLLSYRTQVLTQAGFIVVGIRPQAQHAGQFANLCRLHGPAAIIACHTLTRQQRTGLSTELREHCPGVRLIALSNDSLSSEESRGYDQVLDSLAGPAALIREIRSRVGASCCTVAT